MSHLPLLAKHAPPARLQSPRRAPQLCCLCLLVGTALLVTQTDLIHAHGNGTKVPFELHRLVHGTPEENDLLVTVRYLASLVDKR